MIPDTEVEIWIYFQIEVEISKDNVLYEARTNDFAVV